FRFYQPPADADYEISYTKAVKDVEKYCGVTSRVGDHNGVPTLFVNGEPYTAAAYMTYLRKYNRYEQFAQAGYKLFSLPVLFAGRWISATEGLVPFDDGIFDEKGRPDFHATDEAVREILEICPDAYILPRVNVSMPMWWIEENADELDGTGNRESLYSAKWREDAAEMLRLYIDHVIHSDYAPHIIGYHLAGGNTEEWFHFDMNAGLCAAAEDGFRAFLSEHYPGTAYKGLPDLSLLNRNTVYHKSEYLARYLEYASFQIADNIAFLANEAKKASGGYVAVGTFYGYALEVPSPLYGTHALKHLLRCDDLDFFCSPNSYLGTRAADADWTEMYAADSVRLHGKLCLQECDIRTHLTKPLPECAPEYDPEGRMTAPIWQGLPDRDAAVQQIRKSFCRQLIKGNGFWWFDMWGGWYDDPVIMDEMNKFREIARKSLERTDRGSVAQTAVFIDEASYKFMTDNGLRNAICGQRGPLGCMGAPYDIYDISDFEAVYSRYKAVIFISCAKTQTLKNAVSLCRKGDIAYIMNDNSKRSFTAAELRHFCRASGVHVYCETDDVVYVNRNYLAVHAAEGGVKTIRLPEAVCATALLGEALTVRGETLSFEMKAGETMLFELNAY
ncbi:MAG: hypothetical protein IJT03_01315, partial [Clostridia bacterium]|nr:hypothetical protein [Clostridia bacterium]